MMLNIPQVYNIQKTKMHKKHHPLHIYKDDALYFITARTVKKEKFFNTSEKKRIFRQTLKSVLEKYSYQLYAWIILDNHYHFLMKIATGENLKFFVKDLHSLSAKRINELDNQIRRKIWFQYWDYCPRNEKDFYQHLNYIHHNPVKHKYVKTQEEVLKNQFCSYRQWMEQKGEEWMSDCFATYPILDFTVEGDE